MQLYNNILISFSDQLKRNKNIVSSNINIIYIIEVAYGAEEFTDSWKSCYFRGRKQAYGDTTFFCSESHPC